METWREMIQAAKREIKLLEINEVKEKMDHDEEMTLIDCRELDEYQKGRIPKSILIPRGTLEMTIERHVGDRNKTIVLYCAGGGRSALAAYTLKKMGYKDVASVEGGFGAWRQFGFPVEK